MPDWSELNKSTKAAYHRGDFSEAERLLAALWSEARRRDEPELECNTHFTEGLLRDAQGQHQAAEAAFTAALALDRRLRGPRHPAVADTLHSLGIARANQGDHEGALAAFREAAEILSAAQPHQAASALSAVGGQLLLLRRHEEALAAFEEASARAERLTPVHHSALALLGAGETLRQSQRFPEAFGKLAAATQLSQPRMWPELADAVSRAWHTLGVVSRYGLQRSQLQAAFAFWFATVLGDAETRGKAARELAAMPERELTTGDPARFRLVYRDEAGDLHVASASRGLFHLRGEVDAALGDLVEVTLEGFEVRAVRPAARSR